MYQHWSMIDNFRCSHWQSSVERKTFLFHWMITGVQVDYDKVQNRLLLRANVYMDHSKINKSSLRQQYTPVRKQLNIGSLCAYSIRCVAAFQWHPRWCPNWYASPIISQLNIQFLCYYLYGAFSKFLPKLMCLSQIFWLIVYTGPP